jgi:hypothetical protein
MQDNCLTAEDVHEMLSALDAAPPEYEVRGSQRIQLCAPMSIVPIFNNRYGEPLAVLAQDLSGQGIGFAHTDAIELGRQFMIPSHGQTQCTMILFKVVYCAPMDDGQFRIGAKFLNVDRTEDDLDANLERDPLFKAIFG